MCLEKAQSDAAALHDTFKNEEFAQWHFQK
jgi:hypothetical protein